MTRIFTAGLGTETNTFAPMPTGAQDFIEHYQIRDAQHPVPMHIVAEPLVCWRRHCEERHWEYREGLCTYAIPSGTTVRPVYEALRDEILGNLRQAMPVDAVCLSMHGAMVADDYDDCEGDLCHRVREIIGPDRPLGLELDLHCHISKRLLDDCNAIITYKEYPHTDATQRAEELWSIISGMLEGTCKPHMSAYDCRMLGIFHTTREPMRSFVQHMQGAEQDDAILSVSLAHGFPWGDVADESARMLVISNDNPDKGKQLAAELGRRFQSLRDAITPPAVTMETAVQICKDADQGPVVLADMSDNPGGGAVGDSTFLLKALLDAGEHDLVLGFLWDPSAIAIAFRCGEGARLRMRLGGKISSDSGDPLDLDVTIRTLLDNGASPDGSPGQRDLGKVALLDHDGALIVVREHRGQNRNTLIFDNLGIDYCNKKIIVVKSMQHFYDAYAPIASKVVYVATPGTINWNFSELNYRKLKRPIWPLDDDPWNA